MAEPVTAVSVAATMINPSFIVNDLIAAMPCGLRRLLAEAGYTPEKTFSADARIRFTICQPSLAVQMPTCGYRKGNTPIASRLANA